MVRRRSSVSSCLAGVVVLARPLLFSTLEPAVASVRGVRVTAVGTAFLVLLALDAAEATQAVGALLLIGLLAAPAGAAIRLTAHPYRGFALSAVFALASVWIGIAFASAFTSLPPSSAIIGVAVAVYLTAVVAGAVQDHVVQRHVVARALLDADERLLEP